MAGDPFSKKGAVAYGEDSSPTEYLAPQSGLDDGTPEEHKRIRRKLDLRLVVLVGFMYCVSLMDRANLANANAAGYV